MERSPNLNDPAYILRNYAGALQSRIARSTGTVVTIYRSAAQGLDDADGTCPYGVVCEDHASTVGCETLASAHMAAPYPEGFCEDCRALLDARGE